MSALFLSCFLFKQFVINNSLYYNRYLLFLKNHADRHHFRGKGVDVRTVLKYMSQIQNLKSQLYSFPY